MAHTLPHRSSAASGPQRGSWKVEVRSSGAEPLIRTVEVADGPVEVNVVVDNPVATELCEGAASQPGASP